MNAYSDFAYVYDELMDNTPYELWCGRIAELIKTYGVSRPLREEQGAGRQLAELPAADFAGEKEQEEKRLASERDLVVDLGCGTGTLTQLLYRKGYFN